jgi:hypothetical protein
VGKWAAEFVDEAFFGMSFGHNLTPTAIPFGRSKRAEPFHAFLTPKLYGCSPPGLHEKRNPKIAAVTARRVPPASSPVLVPVSTHGFRIR